MNLVVVFFAAFWLGAIPTAYLVVRAVKGLDIREHGSGNVGATNAFRVLGRGWGFFVFAMDFVKGAAPAFLTAYFFRDNASAEFFALLAGCAAILGHIFSPFLGFKGGKGVATGSGVVAASNPLLFFYAICVWFLAYFLSKTVSLSSLIAIGGLCVINFFMVPDKRLSLIYFALFLLILWSHRSNIIRLLTGNELKFDKKK